MAGGKETPRQKMIGMMYLVLTALLAMNVSKEILNAFIIVNDGLETTTNSFVDKIENQYDAFKASHEENPVKVGPYWNKAQKIQKKASELASYINEMKARAMAATEKGDQELWQEFTGKDQNGKDTVLSLWMCNAKDNYDATTNMLIGAEPANPIEGDFTATQLQSKLEEYRDLLKGEIDSDDKKKTYDAMFDFSAITKKDGTEEQWVNNNFYHQTLAATITLLSKLQGDVRTSEADAISYLMQSVDAASFKFNKLVPVVNTQSNLVSLGDSFKADIFLAAFDTTKFPEMVYGAETAFDEETGKFAEGSAQPLNVVNGVGKFGIKPTQAGEKTWKGVIKYETQAGVTNYPFIVNYKVSDAGAVIDPSAMNVFYKGIDNPMSISVPGADSDKLKVSCDVPGVKIKPNPKGKGGDYFVLIPGSVKKRECTISVMAENAFGVMKPAGEKKFRIKIIPPATPLLKGKRPSDNSIPLGSLKRADEMKCILENFVFEGVKYEVTRFEFSFMKGGSLVSYPNRGSRLGSDVQGAINTLRKGQAVTFSNIFVKGPDGIEKPAANLSFKVI